MTTIERTPSASYTERVTIAYDTLADRPRMKSETGWGRNRRDIEVIVVRVIVAYRWGHEFFYRDPDADMDVEQIDWRGSVNVVGAFILKSGEVGAERRLDIKGDLEQFARDLIQEHRPTWTPPSRPWEGTDI